jgi:hypothetical protein
LSLSFDNENIIEQINKFRNKIPKGSTHGVPKDSLFIKFARQLSVEEREALKNGLRNFI